MDRPRAGDFDHLPGDRGGDSGARPDPLAPHPHDHRVPSFARRFAIAAVAALLAVGGVALWWRHVQDAEREKDCKRSVAFRQDNRAMWVWVLTIAEDPNAERVLEAHRQLDGLLPILVCNSDNKPVPAVP